MPDTHQRMLFPASGVASKRSTSGEKKVVRSKLARSENSIILPGFDLVDQMKSGETDRYFIDGGGYELDENEVTVDLFCGAGGTSEGIRQALGEAPAFAVNHNPYAIGVHSANHPETIHLESDVFAADPESYLKTDKSVGLLTLSPSCVHFSTARGGAPKDAGIRDQAWIAHHWAEHPNPRFRPRVIIVENVREFLTWAPLTSEGKINKRYIDKDGLGSTFKEWRQKLVDAGYEVEYAVLNAADYGVPTKRRRLFVVARRDGLPIRFPAPTHGPRDSEAVKQGLLQPYRSAAECIDFTIQCNPIFMYKEDAKAAGANRPLAPNTLARIAAGVERYVIEADDPFIVSYYGPKGSDEFRGAKMSEPLPTLTTEPRFAVVNPVITPLTHAGPGRYYDMSNQLPTITTAKRGELALISTVYGNTSANVGTVIPLRRDCQPMGVDQLIPALTANSQIALAVGSLSPTAGAMSINEIGGLFDTAFLTATGGSQYAAKPRPIDTPINVIKCDNRSAVIVPTLVRVAHGTVDKNGKRRGRADHDIQEPLPTQSTSNEFALVEPSFLVTTGYGERQGQAPRIHDILDPIGTMVAGGGKHALVSVKMTGQNPSGVSNDNDRAPFIVNNNTNRLATSVLDPVPAMTTGNQQIVTEAKLQPVTSELVAAHMAQHNEGNVGHSVEEPMSTMTTKVCHQNLVTSHMLTLRQNGIGHSLHEPMPAFCAEGNHHGEVRACFVKYYGEGGQWQEMAEPLDTLTTKARFAVVKVPVEDLQLSEEQRFEAWWIARFLEMYGTKPQGNPATAHLDGPRPSAVGRPGAVLWTIQMRMLVPKEAAAASSFPEHYELEKTACGKKVSKSNQMMLIGNAVAPGCAAAIVGANVKPRPSMADKLFGQKRMAA